MTGSAGRRRVAAVAGVLAWVLLLSPASAETTQYPPDQVDPPAEGESEPLDDPSEPPAPEYTTAAHPSPSITLTSGARWGDPGIDGYTASQRYTAARQASRVGWPKGSRYAVLTSGNSYASSVAASALAGATNAPLLLTNPRELSDTARKEIKRLDPERVFVVGPVRKAVRAKVRRLGPAVRNVAGDNPYRTAMEAARVAVAKGARRSTVIVASAGKWRSGLGVAALASGKQWPVLLTHSTSGRKALAQRVDELGAKRVFVVGRKRDVADKVVEGLPGLKRLNGNSDVGTIAVTSRQGRKVGLDKRPFVVGMSHWADAMTWGVVAGSRRTGTVLASRGRTLSGPVVAWLSEFKPARVGLVTGESSLAELAKCQVRSGRVRSWLCAEKTLKRQGYDIRDADGKTDRFSVFAIFAFEKVAGRTANGSFGDAEWRAMVRNPRMKVRRTDLPSTHVEINIGKQLILLIRGGKVRNHIHTSTGKPSTPTVRGTFTVYEKRPYYQPHNRMYWSIFFHGGYAIHGYPEIPTYPASAGCARTYNGNQDFIYKRVSIGDRVATY